MYQNRPSSPTPDDGWTRSFIYYNSLEERKKAIGNDFRNNADGTYTYGPANSIYSPATVAATAKSALTAVNTSLNKVNAAASSTNRSSNAGKNTLSAADTPPTMIMPIPANYHSNISTKKRLSFPHAPIADLFHTSSHRRKPSLTPTNSNTGQGSSSRPGAIAATNSIPRSRSRSTSTTAFTSNNSSVFVGPSGIAATSPPAASSSRYADGVGASGGSLRGLGMTTIDTLSKDSQVMGGLALRNANEDSPTDPGFAGSFTSTSNYETLLEEKEDVEDDEYDDADWDGMESIPESKRSRASTLSSPTGSGILSGIRRKISGSKKMKGVNLPESNTGPISADRSRIKFQKRTGTSTTYSPFLVQTSSDEGSLADSLTLNSQLEVPQQIASSSQHNAARKHHPSPAELNNSASPSPKPSHEQLKGSISNASAVIIDKLSQGRPQSVPPRGIDHIHNINMAPRPTTATTLQKPTLEVPGSNSSAPVSSSARVSSINQLPPGSSSSSGNKAPSPITSTTTVASFTPSAGSANSNTQTSIHYSLSSTTLFPANNNNAISSAPAPYKYLTAKDRKNSSKVSLAASARLKKHPPSSLDSPIMDPESAPKVPVAPASGMYWYKAPDHGQHKVALRAHTCTMVGSSIYVFGGCDRVCYNDMHVFDTDCMTWYKPTVFGDIPPPLRAMTTTAVNKKLVIFGGGDGPTYYNDVYIFDTVANRYTKPPITGDVPSKRRAHTACFYRNNKLDKSGIYIFGGGDGERALDDIWCLDVSDFNKLSWRCIYPVRGTRSVGGVNSSSTSLSSVKGKNGGATPSGPRPTARGYHTANMVGSKLIVFGGSDGTECFMDVWVFDVETEIWKRVPMGGGSPNPGPGMPDGSARASYPRLSHTATIVGSYLFVVGGHDGGKYSSEVLLLNLVTMQWDKRKVYGLAPSGRGYHGAVLHDSRLFIIGGFDGEQVFSDTYILELAVSSYYSQISQFTIDA